MSLPHSRQTKTNCVGMLRQLGDLGGVSLAYHSDRKMIDKHEQALMAEED